MFIISSQVFANIYNLQSTVFVKSDHLNIFRHWNGPSETSPASFSNSSTCFSQQKIQLGKAVNLKRCCNKIKKRPQKGFGSLIVIKSTAEKKINVAIFIYQHKHLFFITPMRRTNCNESRGISGVEWRQKGLACQCSPLVKDNPVSPKCCKSFTLSAHADRSRKKNRPPATTHGQIASTSVAL